MYTSSTTGLSLHTTNEEVFLILTRCKLVLFHSVIHFCSHSRATLFSTMTAWETSSVTSLYTTEPPVVSLPPAPGTQKVAVKGAFLVAVLATQKTPFKRHFQQPDDGCLPPVMPKRKVAAAARKVSNVRSPTRSETTTDNPPPSRPRGQQTRPATADKPHPIPVTPRTSVESRRSQPRVDQYRSFMTVQSAFSPLPTPYYDTNATTQKQQRERDPASTPRLSNTRKGKNKTVTNSLLSMSHSESSTETPKLDNTSRRFLTAPVNYYDNQLVFIGGY